MTVPDAVDYIVEIFNGSFYEYHNTNRDYPFLNNSGYSKYHVRLWKYIGNNEEMLVAR